MVLSSMSSGASVPCLTRIAMLFSPSTISDAAAVIDCQAQRRAGVAAAHAHVFIHFLEYIGRQADPPADGRESDVLLHDLRALGQKILVQQRHEEIKFRLRSLPVVGAQAIEGQLRNRQAAAFFDGRTHALDAAAMPLDARQACAAAPSGRCRP